MKNKIRIPCVVIRAQMIEYLGSYMPKQYTVASCCAVLLTYFADMGQSFAVEAYVEVSTHLRQ